MRESKEIDIKLYSTTIVNNNSAKQAVGKKKIKLVKMWPIINKDKRHGTTHSNTSQTQKGNVMSMFIYVCVLYLLIEK